MGLLPWSFGFMLILSILSWSAIGRVSEETLTTSSIIASISQQAQDLTDKITTKSCLAYNELCEKEGIAGVEVPEEEEEGAPEDAKKGRGVKAGHRPLTSKLHIGSLFTNEEGPQKPTQEKLFHNLLQKLYGNTPLFIPNGNNDPYVQMLFDEVRQKALDVSTKIPMHNVSVLANIELPEPRKDEKQFILFLILRGGDGELFRGRRCHIEPLLPYISMNKKEHCMSVYLAPRDLLRALFENEDLVNKILETRLDMWHKLKKENSIQVDPIKEKKDLLETLSDEFKTLFEPALPSWADPKVIDFRVSRTKPQLKPRKEKTH